MPSADHSRKPVALFWFSKNYGPWPALSAQLLHLGIRTHLVTSQDELLNELKTNPRVFAVFGDFEFFSPLLKTRLSQGQQSSVTWNISAPQMRNDIRDKIFKCGFADVLKRPVHPFSYQNRCQVQLGRLVSQLGKNIDMEIPEWLSKNMVDGMLHLVGGGTSKKADPNGIRLHRGEHEIENLKNKVFFVDPSDTKLSDSDLSKVQGMLSAYQVLSQNDLNFISVNDESAINSLFAEVETVHTSVTLWTKSRAFVCKLRLVSYNSSTKEAKFQSETRSIKGLYEVLKKTAANNRIYLCSATLRGRVFTSSPASSLKMDGSHITLRVTENLHKIQRRKEFRYKLDDNESMKATVAYGDNKIGYHVIDLSASGIRLQGDSQLVHHLTNKKSDVKLSFMVANETFSFSARFVYKTIGDKTEVSFKFLNPDIDDASKIRLYVYEKSFEYLDRFVI